MSSKRAKATSSKSKASSNDRFVSADAKARYEFDAQRARNFMQERGFGFDEEDAFVPGITDIIKARRWNLFCQQPEHAIKSLVMEFYSNAAEAEGNRTRVRGTVIKFDAACINKFFNLVDETPDRKWQDIDPEVASQFLTDTPPKWRKDRYNRPINFPQGQLKKTARVWFSFVCARLLPTSHTSNIEKDRCKLLYAILTGVPINVGSIIEEQIKLCIRHPLHNYFVPHLITELCRASGVCVMPGELTSPPLPKIDMVFIQDIERRSSQQQHRQAGCGQVDLFLQDFKTLSMPKKLATLYDGQQALQRRVQKLERRQEQSQRRNEAYQLQHATWLNQQAQCQYQLMQSTMQAMLEVVQHPELRSTFSLSQVSYPGDFQFVPPEEEESDEEDE